MAVGQSIDEFALADDAVTPRKLAKGYLHATVAGQAPAQTYSTAFIDMPGVVFSAPFNGRNVVKVHLDFSAFAGVAAGSFQFQLLVDGAAPVFFGTNLNPVQAFWNTIAQHQGWSYTWYLAPLAAGNHTFKIQMKSVTVVNNVSQDNNDYFSFTADEIP